MSGSDAPILEFRLYGEELLQHDYDEEADILYLWRGTDTVEAVSVTSSEGHLIRLDPSTHEVVGFTIFDFRRRWQDAGTLTVTSPSIGDDAGESRAAEQLELVPA